ncbi:lasso peptide biosynthesis PqqD family chaperone [Neobacillus cucumis]|uniref:lasso peptide biosynthesis PqqD family chaperone n=1 Tax=Neobacillus cucumis TaxID=1740721 RepID=UPI001962E7E8|nr:lasso peptide biosynthesis PqqD family chaperone [Neobacillus cucumis]MBM7651873.1 hypothetical protein [Neobacillus cucumis]
MLKTKKLSKDINIVQKQGNIVSDMDGEKVMMSVQKGKYFNLGVIGGVIWDNIKSPISAIEIIDRLTTEYDVERKECEEQVLSFLDHLLEEELIEICK